MMARGKGVKGFAKGKAFVVSDCGQRNPFEGIPPGSILVAPAISLSDSALIDFKNVVGMVTEEEDELGHVCVLARGLGMPAVTGLRDFARSIVAGDRLLIRNLDVIVNPDLAEVTEYEEERVKSDIQLSFDF